MLIEIHMLQNHAPSNLNRDDTGSPKECIFGGVKRARISSQCLKRSIRRSPIFEGELDGEQLAQRTRRLPDLVRAGLIEKGIDQELADVAALKATGFGTKEGKEREKDGNTAQTMFLAPADINAIVDVLYAAATEAGTVKKLTKIAAKDLQARAELKGWRPITIDISLFGRMITSPAFHDVQAAMQVAHAISANKVDHEFDYFTAVDDLQGAGEDDDDKGADMIGDVEFNSACYYKYFSIDVDGFVRNLAGPKPDPVKAGDKENEDYANAVTSAFAVAQRMVPAFVKAAIFTTPTGKQNTFAAHQLPDAVLVEVRPVPTPISYANAFVKPARASADVDLVTKSIGQFLDHVDGITSKFSLKTAHRLWFTTSEKAPASGDGTAVTTCETLGDLLSGLADAVKSAETRDG